MTTNGAREPRRPAVAVLLREPTRSQILSESALARLGEAAQVRCAPDAPPAQWDLAELLHGTDAVLTGWGTPSLSDDLLEGLPDLRLIAHTAGSIRRLLPVDLVGSRLRVSHAAGVIADAVAEFVILEALHELRGLGEIENGMRAGHSWAVMHEHRQGRLLGSRTVGVIGAGRVGRAVIRLYRAFGCRVLLADPVLTPDEVASLGAEPAELPDLLRRSEIVSLHAPVLPQTRGMIGAAELSLMRDGALFINTARAVLVDEVALRTELASGRLRAALDVFWEEPLPEDDEIRRLPNVLPTPHVAGHSIDTWARQGEAMVDEVLRLLRGEPLRYEVTTEMIPVMA